MYLFQKIEDATFKENDARRSIGEFLLEHKNQVAELSMQDYSSRTSVPMRRTRNTQQAIFWV